MGRHGERQTEDLERLAPNKSAWPRVRVRHLRAAVGRWGRTRSPVGVAPPPGVGRAGSRAGDTDQSAASE